MTELSALKVAVAVLLLLVYALIIWVDRLLGHLRRETQVRMVLERENHHHNWLEHCRMENRRKQVTESAGTPMAFRVREAPQVDLE